MLGNYSAFRSCYTTEMTYKMQPLTRTSRIHNDCYIRTCAVDYRDMF